MCCTFDNWSKNNNEKIKQGLVPHIHYYEVPGNRSPFLPWLLSSFLFSLSKLLLVIFPKNIHLLSVCSNKRSWLIVQHLGKIKEKVHLVIAHNQGSFYPAKKFAKQHQIPFGIDLEDYHPGETNEKREAENLKLLLKNVLPEAAYITAASPLILKETQKDVPHLSCVPEVVLNYFSETEFIAPEQKDAQKLKLVWFSQNIAQGRGLEEIIPVIQKSNDFELHLYGNAEPDFYINRLEGKQNIYVHEPLQQADLHKALSLYDVGLAIEKASSNYNRDICLTNKLLAYFQSGLYVLASNTSAQIQFMNEHPEQGMVTSLETEAFQQSLMELLNNKNSIRSQAGNRFCYAGNYSWERESQKLTKTWKHILN